MIMSVLDSCDFRYHWSHYGRFLIIMTTNFFGAITCIYTFLDTQVVSIQTVHSFSLMVLFDSWTHSLL